MKETSVVLIVLILVIAGLGGYFIYAKTSVGKTVSADGNAVIEVLPDEVAVYLNIQTTDKSAKIAKNLNSAITDDVVTALVKLGLERKDIGTENYHIQPNYNWTERGRGEIVSYTVNNNIKVSTDDFDEVGEIVDAAVDSGALVNWIRFDLSDVKRGEIKAEALEQAAADARVKAEAVASGLNVRLGKIVSVSASSFDYRPYPLYESGGEVALAEAVKSVSGTDITPGKIEVRGSVRVVYKIG